MSANSSKKRSTDDKVRHRRKRQKRQGTYHSDESGDDTRIPATIGPREVKERSHDKKHCLKSPSTFRKPTSAINPTHDQSSVKVSSSKTAHAEDDTSDSGDDEPEDSGSDETISSASSADGKTSSIKPKSKRNDPTAFATSLFKILSTKISTSKRADPVLARSAAAHEASKAAVDIALESKARRQLKEQKRQALEKGRVKDVLTQTNESVTEPETSTVQIQETERRLRKVAQRGVVKLFNAVRAAQVRTAEAQKAVKKDSIIGANRRQEKVTELSKKGFLELIASGGGGLKKGGLEEA